MIAYQLHGFGGDIPIAGLNILEKKNKIFGALRVAF
jgi:hypothetical protein